MTLLSDLTGPERDAILAGLRLLQGELSGGSLLPDLQLVYTNCNEHLGMDLNDIDDLCERMNV